MGRGIALCEPLQSLAGMASAAAATAAATFRPTVQMEFALLQYLAFVVVLF